MTGRWKGGKSKTTLSPPSHRPLEISLNMVRFPHSHSTAAGNPLFSSITGRVTLNRAKSVNHVPGLKCPLCPRLHNPMNPPAPAYRGSAGGAAPRGSQTHVCDRRTRPPISAYLPIRYPHGCPAVKCRHHVIVMPGHSRDRRDGTTPRLL